MKREQVWLGLFRRFQRGEIGIKEAYRILDETPVDDERPNALLPLVLPKFDDGKAAKLQSLETLSDEERAKFLEALALSQPHLNWKHTGSQYYGDGLGVEGLSEFLCEHPDEILKEFAWNLVVEYYPDARFVGLSTHFVKGYPEDGFRTTELVYAFFLTRFISADKKLADQVATIIEISPKVEEIRARFQSQQSVFEDQKRSVDQYLLDIQQYNEAPEHFDRPDWKNYKGIVG